MLVDVAHWAWHRIALCRSENVSVYTLRMSTMNIMSVKCSSVRGRGNVQRAINKFEDNEKEIYDMAMNVMPPAAPAVRARPAGAKKRPARVRSLLSAKHQWHDALKHRRSALR
eukprot:4304315-Amphidinium_carterae.1